MRFLDGYSLTKPPLSTPWTVCLPGFLPFAVVARYQGRYCATGVLNADLRDKTLPSEVLSRKNRKRFPDWIIKGKFEPRFKTLLTVEIQRIRWMAELPARLL